MNTPLTPLSLHILLSVAQGPLHGYGILKATEERSGGRETPSTGALYLALRRLEGEGLIRPAGTRPPDADGRRRYWEITPEGIRAVEREVGRLESLLAHASVQAFRTEAG